MVQGIIFGPKKDEVTWSLERDVMKSSMDCLLYLLIFECRFQKDEMARACGTCGRYQKCICGWKP